MAIDIGKKLDLNDFIAVTQKKEEVFLSRETEETIKRARNYINGFLKTDRPVYGVNTGFGALADVPVDKNSLKELQKNLVRSHATGVGRPLSEDIVRGIIFLRAHVLAMGHSGVRVEIIRLLVDMLNRNVIPIIPEKGSVGASGDLAPLAHLALVLIGEGEAVYRGERLSGDEALKRAGLKPIVLEEKEGLSLLNGTQAMLSILIHALLKAWRIVKTSDIISSMTIEALCGSKKPFDRKIHQIRPYKGQVLVARNMRRLLKKSQIVQSHRHCKKIQDPYSMRCVPQVHGAIRDFLNHVTDTANIELNSVTDNPLVFPEENQIISGGNFHGEPLALSADVATIALTELANISERRIEQLVNPQLSGLYPFLIKDAGLNSGFMIAQVTAASLVNENRMLSMPASVDNIPSSANREDHVSMGMTACRKLTTVVENTAYVLAIEAICAAQGIEYRRPLKAGTGVEVAYSVVRDEVPFIERDTKLNHYIERVKNLITEGVFLRRLKDSGVIIE